MSAFSRPSRCQRIRVICNKDVVTKRSSNCWSRRYTQQGRYPDTFATPSNTDFYQFSYSQQDAGDYLLKAIPTTRQQDECGTLTLDQTGYRAANRHDCWGS
ncbi:type IV pilin protein [Aeromonas veronii]